MSLKVVRSYRKFLMTLVVAIVLVVLLLLNWLNFKFHWRLPWISTQRQKDTPVKPKYKQKTIPQKKRDRNPHQKKKPSASGSQRFVYLTIEGNVIVVEERLEKRGKTLKSYKKQYLTLDEFQQMIEGDSRFSKAYFRLTVSGDEMYGIYDDLSSLLKIKHSGMDKHKTAYFHTVFAFKGEKW